MRFTGTFVVVVALFITVLITSNIIAVKPITILPIQWFGDPAVILPASIIIFPISYIVGDVLTEVYGFRIARGVIWLGFAMNLVVVIALWLTGILPGAFFWGESEQGAYGRILGQVPNILIASFVAYLIGEFSNSTVLALLKYKMQGRLLFVRTLAPRWWDRGWIPTSLSSWPSASFLLFSGATPGAAQPFWAPLWPSGSSKSCTRRQLRR